MSLLALERFTSFTLENRWRPFLPWFAAGALLLQACSSEPDEPPDDDTLTLEGQGTASQGLVLATRTVVPVVSHGNGYMTGDSDFYLLLAMEVSLIGTGAEPAFCSKGSDFARVQDIPSDTADCTWSHARLGANAPGTNYVGPGEGYLVRDKSMEALYRLRILAYDVDTDNRATVTVEIDPVN